jgi:isoquinoline 1-oxidoreductase beta subunit
VHFTYLGGGFGRRLTDEYAAEATQVSKAIGAPVKLIWSREDDVRWDFYRPATLHRMSGAVATDGLPAAFRHVVVGPSILNQLYGGAKDGKDPVLAAQTPYCYATPNVHLAYVMSNTHVPVGWWRSVYASQCGLATECFVDELAHAAGADPFAFRRALLAGDRIVAAGGEQWKTSRLRGVLELAAGKAGWGTPLPSGRARGIACYPAFGSYTAHVAEAGVEDGAIKVHRIVVAIDCGLHVNPDTIEAQMEGSVAYALSMLKQEITIERGRVVQSNFNNFNMWRIAEMPAVEVHIVKNTENPGGVGEPGVGSVVPAVLNAVFAATGKRLRRLPIRPDDLT